MNQTIFLTVTQAIQNLQDLLVHVDRYDLVRKSAKDKGFLQLASLKSQVSIYFDTLPSPDNLDILPFKNYDAYYNCLQNLHQHPLRHVEFGNQQHVIMGYKTVILRTMHYLHTYSF
ncbi:hypothetical protein [Staphylococcus sp. 17KM0847]|uniref:hypothetical protein n=1 Tax=Staphylococcus sp. 17KM0847 TaxID=2583989 RepID=UPI0015DBD8D2|nr:hypothetical protein [Staphylococcus sp. 17KM0847]QLK86674.1 hypothetical protein FGL66_08230 [Staphylococcus sp. 17KM0847]